MKKITGETVEVWFQFWILNVLVTKVLGFVWEKVKCWEAWSLIRMFADFFFGRSWRSYEVASVVLTWIFDMACMSGIWCKGMKRIENDNSKVWSIRCEWFLNTLKLQLQQPWKCTYWLWLFHRSWLCNGITSAIFVGKRLASHCCNKKIQKAGKFPREVNHFLHMIWESSLLWIHPGYVCRCHSTNLIL